MPVFEFEGETHNNPVELALHVVGGKWKMPILWRLRNRTWLGLNVPDAPASAGEAVIGSGLRVPTVERAQRRTSAADVGHGR